jgi:uncharacterized protein (TIGR02246 family)
MKICIVLISFSFLVEPILYAQDEKTELDQKKAIYSLIDQYVRAREKKDTILLRNILTEDMDQLVSTGSWRTGIREAIEGMMQSSENNPGKRDIRIDKIRYLDPGVAIVDARYEIQNPDGTSRKMWSTFVVILKEDSWLIAAIRNMLPSG